MGELSGLTRKNNTHLLMLAFRQVCIMLLGALEDYLGMDRSIIPKK